MTQDHQTKQSVAEEARQRLRAGGYQIGRGYDALSVLRANSSASLPEPLSRYTCPLCATEHSAGVQFDFVACPACGHGMLEREMRDPWRCNDCGLTTEGPRPEPHRSLDDDGLPARPCTGRLEPLDYLPFDVVGAGSFVAILAESIDGSHGESLPADVPVLGLAALLARLAR